MEKRNRNGLTEEEFLKQYDPGDYERPSVTADIMVLGMDEKLNLLKVLLIQRGDHPYIDCFALPGGFINIDESAYSAACRELEEETGLKNIYLEQIYTMNQPNRDPRMRVFSIAYMALTSKVPVVAGDDAKAAYWFDITFTDKKLELFNEDTGIHIKYDLEEKIFSNGVERIKNYVPVYDDASDNALAFDHAQLLLEGLMRLRNKVKYTGIAFNLVPKKFTLPDLQRVYEVILGKPLYKKNFRKDIMKKVTPCNAKGTSIVGRKSSNLYEYTPMKEMADE